MCVYTHTHTTYTCTQWNTVLCSVASVMSNSLRPMTVDCQALLSMEISRQECWSGLPCPPPGDCPYSGIEPSSLALAGRFFTTSSAWEAPSSNQIAAQLTEKLEIAVFVLQIETSYSIMGAASETILSPTILLPIQKPYQIILSQKA